MKKKLFIPALLLCASTFTYAQKNAVVENMINEATNNSNLEMLAHELLDVVGPRLVGTPQMKNAHDWAVKKYADWGIKAENQKYGEWRGWERGITHIDMVSPRLRSLEGMQLAWSPSTKPGQPIQAEAIILADVADAAAFTAWLPSVKGKLVLISAAQISGRPEKNWEQFALKESIEKLRKDKQESGRAWANRLRKTGLNAKELALALERAGAAGIVINNWSQGFGVDKIFGANTTIIPTVNLSLEDYGMIYRLAEHGSKPVLKITAESKELGVVPTFNTVAEIKGKEKPNEYVILSAHFDSWDGATGATDNGTGTITMMEAMRLLKKFYPNPKRTIIVGHWGSEEQGLNGSSAYVEDHPEIIKNMQVSFNQDNGTGRVVNIGGSGFTKAGEFLDRWLKAVPDTIKNQIKTNYPGSPSGGGSDHASFIGAGAPGISLSSLGWDYGTYTWHTNRDTYDKIVFDDVRSNAILTAILAYMASEDPQKMPRDKNTELGNNPRTGEKISWPKPLKPTRKGGL